MTEQIETQQKKNFSDLVKDTITKTESEGEDEEQILNIEPVKEEPKQAEKKPKQPFLSGDKIKILLVVIIVFVTISIIGFLIFYIMKHKQTQQAILCKDSEISAFNNRFKDMENKYSTELNKLQMENIQLREQQTQQAQQQWRTDGARPDGARVFKKNPKVEEETTEDEGDEIEEFRNVKAVPVNIPKKQHQRKRQHNEEQHETKRQNGPTEEENEYVTDIPKFNDAPTPDTDQPKKMTQQQMLKHALNTRMIETNNKKQQALTFQEQLKAEAEENYTKDAAKISASLGLSRNQDINEEKIKQIIEEEEQNKEQQQNAEETEDNDLIDASLIVQ